MELRHVGGRKGVSSALSHKAQLFSASFDTRARAVQEACFFRFFRMFISCQECRQYRQRFVMLRKHMMTLFAIVKCGGTLIRSYKGLP
jgi:hypothetical protein